MSESKLKKILIIIWFISLLLYMYGITEFIVLIALAPWIPDISNAIFKTNYK